MKKFSDRIPGKNMKLFSGRPLFFWILESLENCDLIDEIIINTDSEEIASEAVKNFNVTIHMRPKFLLNIKSDEASQILAYDISKLKGEYFFQTHSTNPLLKPETILNALK